MLILGFGIDLVFNPLGLIFYALKRPQNMTAIHLVQLAVLLPLNYFVMIPRYEGVGAALSLLIVRVGTVIAAVAWTGISIRALARREADAG